VTPPPVEAAPPVHTPPPAEAVPDADGVVHRAGFETYVAPPPSRPPTSQPPAVTPPPVEAAAPPAPEWASSEAVAPTVMPRALTKEPEAPKVEREPTPRSWIFPAAIAGGVVVAAVIGLVAGGGGGAKKPAANPAPAVAAASAGLSLKVPAGWSAPASPPKVPGLDGATSFAGPSGGSVEFGKADGSAANSTLLSQRLIAAAGKVPARTAVELGGGVQAYRYANVKIGGDRTATIFAVPTSAGVATLACVPAKGAEDAFAPTCDAVATTFRVDDGKPFPVGPSKGYADQLSSTLAKLGQQQSSAAAALKKAKTRGAQAVATDRLASAYSGAAKTLRGLQLSPADLLANSQLAAALKATGAAYTQAAGDARSKDGAGYKRQSDKAIAAQKDVAKTLGLLKAAGYDVQS
jgi:hypothetical protein